MLLFLLVAGLSIGATGLFIGIVREARKTNQLVPKGEALALGAVTNFFDTLGIGSFAPTIAWFRFRKMVPDKLMPLTMFIGYTIPAILQGVIFPDYPGREGRSDAAAGLRRRDCPGRILGRADCRQVTSSPDPDRSLASALFVAAAVLLPRKPGTDARRRCCDEPSSLAHNPARLWRISCSASCSASGSGIMRRRWQCLA